MQGRACRTLRQQPGPWLRRPAPRDGEAPTMKTAQGVTLIANGRLVDGTGAPRRARRGGGRQRRPDRLRRAGPRRARGPARRRSDRRPRRDDPARPGRGPFPPDVFRRRRAGRPGHQVSGRIRDDPGRVQRPAGARMRLHGGPQRRQPAQHRRLAQEGDRGGPDPRPAPGRQRPRDLRRRRADGLEPRASASSAWRA